jgi:hypothetical protein
MSMEGHELVIIEKEWLFDLTEFVGYKIKPAVNDNESLIYTKAFEIKDGEGFIGRLKVTKFIDIPLKVIRRSKELIKVRRAIESSEKAK